MIEKYLIGVDTGVSFVKAGVYDTRSACKASAINTSPGDYPKPGVFIQRNEDYLQVVVETLKEAVESANIDKNQVEAVAFSSALGGATGVDAELNVVFDWSIISDTRYFPYVGEMQQIFGDRLQILSGTNFPIFGPKLLWWKNEYPDQYKKVAKFTFLCGYIVGKLCDLSLDDVFVDRTYLEVSSLADIRNETWSAELCEGSGIDMGLLPRIVDSDAVVGGLSKHYADIIGLNAGTPFAAGAGDKPAGCLGAGMVEPGILVDEAASFGALSLCVDEFVPDEKYKTLELMPSPIKGHYFPVFFLFGSGVTHGWFKDNFGGEGATFASLDEAAEAVPPGSEGLLALGLLGGRGYPSDPDIRGMWLGHSWSHRKEHFYRALLESFAYEYGYVLNVMKQNYPELAFQEIRIIGGGARSKLWNQIKCDVMGIPYTKLNRDDVALLGDILLAGSAVGIFADIKQKAKEFTRGTETFTPDLNRTGYYARYQKLYESLFDNLRGTFEGLKNIPGFSRPAGEEG